MKKFLLLFLFTASVLAGCCNNSSTSQPLVEPGVSKALANFRKENLENIRYNLHFSIPSEKSATVKGRSEICFKIGNSTPIIIDFKAVDNQIDSLHINGVRAEYTFENEHIILSGQQFEKGENSVAVYFSAADQSLNRREEFLYTLLVPDRARTLFPCFDQPDIKAVYSLSLEVPGNWQAVANGAVETESELESVGRRIIKFRDTEPLSTYLFSFVAGVLNKEKFTQNGKEIHIYHRETDSKKAAQCSDIANEVFHSLNWLEKYTGIPYPFAKYDLIILPGFQYGGMEHTGATLYNDTRMFLNEHPTINERLDRSSLIAHETAHMWFGDFVTMEWFDDVWTKEVFANYFASLIVEPQYTQINHNLNFMIDYFPAAYSEDRTDGANPIKQELGNLNNAGLVYGNIIYTKSPVVMDMLARKLGEENFRKGIQEYLKKYAYSNATWEGLVDIFDKYTPENLREWSYTWVNTPGMPEIKVAKGEIPNPTGREYGYFKVPKGEQDRLWTILKEQINADQTYTDQAESARTNSGEVLRGSLLITLYENLRRENLDPATYMKKMMGYIPDETNPLLYSLALGYLQDCAHLYPQWANGEEDQAELEDLLWKITVSGSQPSFRLQAFRALMGTASSKASLDKLYAIWQKQKSPAGCHLSEKDYINLSYLLALHFPEKAKGIATEQLSRISNPDRAEEYKFISPSVSPDPAVRDSVFTSLMEAENRRIEPWASSALGYLNHRLRGEQALKYIRPALEKMKEVQTTGDIFFPRSWAKALLSGHTSTEAGKVVEQFFADNPDYPHMLALKIRQQAWHLKDVKQQTSGRLKLPSLISDNMVLQRKTKAKIWGWSQPGDVITVTASWSRKRFSAIADKGGKWSLYIKTPEHCTGQKMEILSGKNKERIEINNILVGEVWLASGQSNMEFWVTPKEDSAWMTGMYGWEEALEDADYPNIHLFKVEEKYDFNATHENCEGEWMVCSRESAKNYSAVAFLFAREIHKALGTPVGIVLCAFGGTHAESWIRDEVMRKDTIYNRVFRNYTPEKMIPKGYGHKVPSAIWNAMVNPIVGYTVKGNIWYQAESNAWRAEDYAPIFADMVSDWRELWQQERLPFYIMQVAPYYGLPAGIREAQVKVWERAMGMSDKSLHVKDLEVATTIDVGDSLDIHPKEKLIPAQRYAGMVLAKEYGREGECFGPIFKSAAANGNLLEITFNHSQGLEIRGENASYLYIAGADSLFHKASSKTENGKLIAWSDSVANPVFVNYCTDRYCKGNIYNEAGLPAYPFRGKTE